MFHNPKPGPGPLPPFGTLYDSDRPVVPTIGGRLYWGYDRELGEQAWRITQCGPNGQRSERPGGEGGHYTPRTPSKWQGSKA